MAVRLTIELEKVNDSELARLQKRLVDLRTEASRLEQSLDLTDLARNARASGQVLKDALDFRTVLQNTEKELRKQEQALLKTGDASEETVRKLEELRQKQSQLAEQQAEAAGRVDDAKVRVDAINAQISATISATEATDENRRSLEKLREEQEKLQRGSRKAIAQANVRDIRLETPDEAGAAAARKQASAEIIAEIRRQNGVRKQIESQRVSAEIAAAKEKSRGIITSIRAQHYQQKKAEQDLTAWMAQQERERSDLEKAMIAQAKQDVKELNAWRKQQDRERTEAEKQEARERAAAAKKAEQEQADEKKRIDANRKQFIGDTIGQAKIQNARAGALAQVQSSTVRLENEDRSLTREIEGLREYAGASKEVQQALDALESRLEQVRDDLALNDRAMRSLSEGIDLTTTDFERLRDQLTRTGASQEQINRFDNAVQQLNNTLLNADTTKAVRENKNLREAARQAVKEIKAEEQAIRDLQRAAEQSKVDANKMLVDIERLQQQRDELGRMTDAIREAENPTQEMIDAAGRYERQARDLTEEIKRLREEQERQAANADSNIRQADAALANAEAQGHLAGRTEHLRHTQSRLAREMDNVNFRAQRTGARELFAELGGLNEQTSRLTKEKRFLAKALIDSAQAWFLNTRASNEAFNVAQRIFSQNLKLQAGIIFVVAEAAALVGVIKASNVVLKEQAKRSEDAAQRLKDQERATEDLRQALIRLGSTKYGREANTLLTDVQNKLALMMNDIAEGDLGNGAFRRSGGNALRDFLLDMPVLVNNAVKEMQGVRGLPPQLRLVADVMGEMTDSAEEYARSVANDIRRRKQAAEIEERILLNRKANQDAVAQSEMRALAQTKQMRNAEELAVLELADTYQEVYELRRSYEEEMQQLQQDGSESARERVKQLATLHEAASQREIEMAKNLIKLRRESERENANLRADVDLGRQDDQRRDPNQGLLNTLKEMESLGASIAEIERVRAEYNGRIAREHADVSAAIERQFEKLKVIQENAEEGVDTTKSEAAVRAEIVRLREREAELAAQMQQAQDEAFDRDLQRRVQIKAALDAIKEQRDELNRNPGTGSTFDYLKDIQKLQAAYQYFSTQYGKGSKEATKVTEELKREYEEWVEFSKKEGGKVLDQLEALKQAGEEDTEQVKELQREYESWLETLREAQAALDTISQTEIKIEVESNIEQIAGRVEAVKAALEQMKEQGLTTPVDNIRNRISEKDVEKEARKKRAEGMDAALEKWSKEFAEKNERGPTAREQAGFRRSFMRRDITDEERLGARKDLSARFIDSLEGQKAIGKETAEALRQQLETETKSLQTQIETRDAIKSLDKANQDEIGDKAKLDAVNPENPNVSKPKGKKGKFAGGHLPAAPQDLFNDSQASLGQQPIDAIGNPKGNPIGQGMAALNQGVGQNVQSQQQLGEATGQAFEAMSQAFAGVANGQQQMANFLVALAQQVAGQSNALQNTVAQTMSRGGAALRNVS